MKLLISIGLFLNLATSYSLTLSPVVIHRGLNMPNEPPWNCDKFSWLRTQPLKPQSTIIPWLLTMNILPHCSVEHVEWLSPPKGQKIPGTLCNSTWWYWDHGKSSFGVKTGSLILQKQQHSWRFSRLKVPLKTLLGPRHNRCHQYYGNNQVDQYFTFKRK